MLSGIPIEMPIEEVLNTILNDLEDYTVDDEQDDDITLVAVRVAWLDGVKSSLQKPLIKTQGSNSMSI